MPGTVVYSDTNSDLTPSASNQATSAYFSRLMLTNAKYNNYFDRWSEPVDLPTNEGSTVIVRRYTHLALAISALTEGVPPAGKTPSLDDFSCTLAQYGDYIAASDFLRFTTKDEALNRWTTLLGEQEGYSIDVIKRNTADAGTNVTYSNGTARTDVVTPLDQNDLDRAIRTLIGAGAEMIMAGGGAMSAQGTRPALPAFAMVVHPYVWFTIQNFSPGPGGFLYANQYQGAAEGEMGRYKNLAIFVAADPSSLGAGARVRTGAGGPSTAVRNTSGTVDVYESMIFSKKGFNSVKLSGQSMKMFVKPIGSAGALDPLDQVGSVGWKVTTSQMRTNENWIMRAESAAEL